MDILPNPDINTDLVSENPPVETEMDDPGVIDTGELPHFAVALVNENQPTSLDNSWDPKAPPQSKTYSGLDSARPVDYEVSKTAGNPQLTPYDKMEFALGKLGLEQAGRETAGPSTLTSETDPLLVDSEAEAAFQRLQVLAKKSPGELEHLPISVDGCQRELRKLSPDQFLMIFLLVFKESIVNEEITIIQDAKPKGNQGKSYSIYKGLATFQGEGALQTALVKELPRAASFNDLPKGYNDSETLSLLNIDSSFRALPLDIQQFIFTNPFYVKVVFCLLNRLYAESQTLTLPTREKIFIYQETAFAYYSLLLILSSEESVSFDQKAEALDSFFDEVSNYAFDDGVLLSCFMKDDTLWDFVTLYVQEFTQQLAGNVSQNQPTGPNASNAPDYDSDDDLDQYDEGDSREWIRGNSNNTGRGSGDDGEDRRPEALAEKSDAATLYPLPNGVLASLYAKDFPVALRSSQFFVNYVMYCVNFFFTNHDDDRPTDLGSVSTLLRAFAMNGKLDLKGTPLEFSSLREISSAGAVDHLDRFNPLVLSFREIKERVIPALLERVSRQTKIPMERLVCRILTKASKSGQGFGTGASQIAVKEAEVILDVFHLLEFQHVKKNYVYFHKKVKPVKLTNKIKIYTETFSAYSLANRPFMNLVSLQTYAPLIKSFLMVKRDEILERKARVDTSLLTYRQQLEDLNKHGMDLKADIQASLQTLLELKSSFGFAEGTFITRLTFLLSLLNDYTDLRDLKNVLDWLDCPESLSGLLRPFNNPTNTGNHEELFERYWSRLDELTQHVHGVGNEQHRKELFAALNDVRQFATTYRNLSEAIAREQKSLEALRQELALAERSERNVRTFIQSVESLESPSFEEQVGQIDFALNNLTELEEGQPEYTPTFYESFMECYSKVNLEFDQLLFVRKAQRAVGPEFQAVTTPKTQVNEELLKALDLPTTVQTRLVHLKNEDFLGTASTGVGRQVVELLLRPDMATNSTQVFTLDHFMDRIRTYPNRYDVESVQGTILETINELFAQMGQARRNEKTGKVEMVWNPWVEDFITNHSPKPAGIPMWQKVTAFCGGAAVIGLGIFFYKRGRGSRIANAKAIAIANKHVSKEWQTQVNAYQTLSETVQPTWVQKTFLNQTELPNHSEVAAKHWETSDKYTRDFRPTTTTENIGFVSFREVDDTHKALERLRDKKVTQMQRDVKTGKLPPQTNVLKIRQAFGKGEGDIAAKRASMVDLKYYPQGKSNWGANLAGFGGLMSAGGAVYSQHQVLKLENAPRSFENVEFPSGGMFPLKLASMLRPALTVMAGATPAGRLLLAADGIHSAVDGILSVTGMAGQARDAIINKLVDEMKFCDRATAEQIYDMYGQMKKPG